MSTRQKAQAMPEEAPEEKRSRSSSSSHKTSSSKSSHSSPSKGKEDEQQKEDVPPEDPPQPEQPKLRRLHQKTTVLSLQPARAAQESLEMPPPAVPAPLELEHVMHEVQEQKEDQPVSPATQASSRKKGRRWDTYTPSGSEDETAPRSIDLQSHDPRPESVAMAQWAQGLSAPTASIAETEQPVLSKPLILAPQERVMEAGQAIDSTLPFKYQVNETHQDQQSKVPREQLPAWKNREEFIEKLDGSRLLIVKAPTGSGKTTIYPALAARALPKRFGRICCTQVRRATTQGVCTGTRRMWRIHEDNCWIPTWLREILSVGLKQY